MNKKEKKIKKEYKIQAFTQPTQTTKTKADNMYSVHSY